MNDKLVERLTDIADAIRYVDDSEDKIPVANFAQKILKINNIDSNPLDISKCNIDNIFTNVANAIRTIDGTSDKIDINNFYDKIISLMTMNKTVELWIHSNRGAYNNNGVWEFKLYKTNMGSTTFSESLSTDESNSLYENPENENYTSNCTGIDFVYQTPLDTTYDYSKIYKYRINITDSNTYAFRIISPLSKYYQIKFPITVPSTYVVIGNGGNYYTKTFSLSTTNDNIYHFYLQTNSSTAGGSIT